MKVELTEEQRKVVEHFGSPLRVLAGPGTGKTFCIAQRIRFLLKEKKVSSHHIRAVTFTNAAAAEMRKRLEGIGIQPADCPPTGTLHSLATMLLRQHHAKVDVRPDFRPITRVARPILLEDVEQDLAAVGIATDPKTIANLAFAYASEHSGKGIPQRIAEDAVLSNALDQFRAKYREVQRFYNSLDWLEAISRSVNLLEKWPGVKEDINGKTKVLLVDEYQDLNPKEQRLIGLLVGDSAGLCVVGDDDQSIYESLRFADPEGIINFPNQYDGTTTLSLTICRRCPPEVIQKALKLINNNKKRVGGKALVPCDDARQGKLATIYRKSKKAEVAWLVGKVRDFLKAGYQYKEILILFPEGKLAEEYVKALKAADIPCVVQLRIGSVFDTECFAWFLATLQFLAESSDNLSLRQCLDYAKGIGKKTVWQLRKVAEAKGNSLHEAIRSVAISPEAFKEIHQRRMVGKFHEYLQTLFGTTSYAALGKTIHEHIKGACGEDKGIQIARTYLEGLTGKEDVINLKEAVGNLEQKIESGEFEIGEADINAVRIMTMHSAKGLESRVVILPALEDDIIPGEAANVEERRRLFYVSVTRTTELLLMSWAAQRVGPEIHRATGRKIYGKKRSRFLVEMGE